MSEFKAIETQEELDRIIQDRLTRQKESLEKQFSDYEEIKTRNTELEKQVGTLQTTIEESKTSNADYDKQISDLNAKVAGYETASLRTKIALQNGLPFDLADRLVGDNEETLKADAERLAAFVKPKNAVPPLKNTEKPLGDEKDNAYKSLISNLNTEGE
ncbi:capsid assembly scaffolding protein Gp46 family protein [Candidatus Enterococcus clewellii]|uniref:Phage scaffold protein n=2 Tax=Candidatus Enterococcus clewellii TaxID=1834193 RepID=A0AAQ3VTZ2_9ENTE